VLRGLAGGGGGRDVEPAPACPGAGTPARPRPRADPRQRGHAREEARERTLGRPDPRRRGPEPSRAHAPVRVAAGPAGLRARGRAGGGTPRESAGAGRRLAGTLLARGAATGTALRG